MHKITHNHQHPQLRHTRSTLPSMPTSTPAAAQNKFRRRDAAHTHSPERPPLAPREGTPKRAPHASLAVRPPAPHLEEPRYSQLMTMSRCTQVRAYFCTCGSEEGWGEGWGEG